MDELERLQRDLNRIKDNLQNSIQMRDTYLAKAREIRSVYNKLAEDKTIIAGYRNDVRHFRGEKINTFQGALYKDKYIASMSELIDAYQKVIDRIDANMDALNMEVVKYENKANEMFGIIGDIQSTFNTLSHRIENWFN